MEAAGIELAAQCLGINDTLARSDAESGALREPNSMFDAELTDLIVAWPNLPNVLKAGIRAMVQVARRDGE